MQFWMYNIIETLSLTRRSSSGSVAYISNSAFVETDYETMVFFPTRELRPDLSETIEEQYAELP